jgi:hypothetical protein
MGTGVRGGREADILIQLTAASNCLFENVEAGRRWERTNSPHQTKP